MAQLFWESASYGDIERSEINYYCIWMNYYTKDYCLFSLMPHANI